MARGGAFFGSFLQSLGQSGMGFGQQLAEKKKDEKAAEARRPFEETNLRKLIAETEAAEGRVTDEEIERERKKGIAQKTEMLKQILSDPEMQKVMQKEMNDPRVAREISGILGSQGLTPESSPLQPETVDVEREVERPPTDAEALERIQRSPYAFDPDVTDITDPIRKRVEAEREPQQELEAFGAKEDIKQEDKGELARLKSDLAKEQIRLREKIKTTVVADINKPNFKVANLEIKLSNMIKSDKKVKDFNVVDTQFAKLSAVYKDYLNNKDKLSSKELHQSKIGLDQVLIMIFNKMLDPASVVRESEFDRTPRASGVYERIKGFLPKLATGGVGISDKDRGELVRTAEILHGAGSQRYNDIINQYKESFSDYSNIGVNPERITERFVAGLITPKSQTIEDPGPSGGLTPEEEEELKQLEKEFLSGS